MYTVNHIYQAPTGILEQLKTLFAILNKSKTNYERIATKIKDKNLHRTIIWLAQENNQYASELSSQIETMGGHLDSAIPENIKQPREDELEFNPQKTDKEIFALCAQNEKEIIKAYRKVLNEPFLTGGIKNMIRYQLNGLLCAFQQLRILNASLHR